MPRPENQARRSKSKRPESKKPSKDAIDAPIKELIERMEACPTAEKLNADVITPFIQALVNVCDARGYVLNIYGEHCNLAITPEDHAEDLFRLIESYLDQSELN